MAGVKARVQALDDFQVVRAFEGFGAALIEGSRTSLDAMKDAVPSTARAVEGWSRLEGLTPDQADRLLPPADAAAVARAVMLALADDPSLAPALERFLSTYKDEALVADVVLAVGLVASVILVAATTEFEGTIAGVTFKKGKADADTMKAVLGPLATVLAALLKS